MGQDVSDEGNKQSMFWVETIEIIILTKLTVRWAPVILTLLYASKISTTYNKLLNALEIFHQHHLYKILNKKHINILY